MLRKKTGQRDKGVADIAVRKKVSLTITLFFAVVLALLVGVHVGRYVHGCHVSRTDKQRLDDLEQSAKTDHAIVPVLVAERERQTQASLRRESINRYFANGMIIAGALFLLSANWFLSLSDRRRSSMGIIALERAAMSGRGKRPRPSVGLFVKPVGRGRQQSSCRCQSAELPEVDLAFVDNTVTTSGRGRHAAIPILQALQEHYRYLPVEALKRVCELTEITPAQIEGVASFYTRFRRLPVGRHLVKVCHGTACHVAGAQAITDEIRRQLGMDAATDTDPAGEFTIEPVACMGCCTLAPVVQVDGMTRGHLLPDEVPGLLDECLTSPGDRSTPGQSSAEPVADGTGVQSGEIRIGLGSCCVAGGSGKVYEAFKKTLARTGVRVSVKRVGCVGMCHRTPLVEALLPGRPAAMYAKVQPEDVPAIVWRHFPPRGLFRRARHGFGSLVAFVQGSDTSRLPDQLAIEVHDPPVAAFLGSQERVVTEHSGHIDPADIDEYLQHGGFEALRRCVTVLSPEKVIEEIEASGLRGRGGGGYPTGLKWTSVRQAAGDEKYIICNGDEGDPGAFMDRMLMESFPYRIIEGMAIAAYAVGAREGYFYIRAEYPLAVQRIRQALEACRERGFISEGVSGDGVRLNLRIMEGAGAFVCGEETALLASLMGQRGTPTLRPPYPAENGLWGRPTLVSNVETYANVPWIMRQGAAAFAAMGTPSSKGTKVFALAGKVNRGGLIEIPMGITIRRIVEEIGGGIRNGRRFKAVQIGGPSGGCIPAELADTPVDYETLRDVGAIMGSGGLVVLDENDCMVDIARYFLAFTQDQSCGKCTFCRIGTRRMLEILDRLCRGEGNAGDLQTLEQLALMVCDGSLCGLGKTAPNPVLTTLRYFRNEYEAHLQRRCPAGKCKSLIRYRVTDKCIGCTLCAQFCPVEAIAFVPYHRHEIDDQLCTRCDACRVRCPQTAIVVES